MKALTNALNCPVSRTPQYVNIIKFLLICHSLPETLKHLQPLMCNPIHQQNLSQAHQHIGEGRSFSWQSFAAALTEEVNIHTQLRI